MQRSIGSIMESELRHYESYLGPSSGTVIPRDVQTPGEVEIHKFDPSNERPYYTLLTAGLASRRQAFHPGAGIAPRAEIMVLASKLDPWIVNLTALVADLIVEKRQILTYGHYICHEFMCTDDPLFRIDQYFIRPCEAAGFERMTVEGEDVDILLLTALNAYEMDFSVNYGDMAIRDLFIRQRVVPLIDGEHSSLLPHPCNGNASKSIKIPWWPVASERAIERQPDHWSSNMNERNRASCLNKRRKSHYCGFLGEADARPATACVDGEEMPIEIMTFPPTEARPHYLVMTNGLSNFIQPGPHDEGTPPRVEIMLYSREKPKFALYDLLSFIVEGAYTQTRRVNSGGGVMFSIPGERSPTSEDVVLRGPYIPKEFETMQVDGEETRMMLLSPIVKRYVSTSQREMF